MKNSKFNAYKAEFRAVIRKVLAEAEHGRMDEARLVFQLILTIIR